MDSGDEKFSILRVETTSSFLTAEVLPRNSDGFITYEVKVRLHSGAPVGQFKETLVIHSKAAHRPRLDIPIEGNVLGPITVSPEHLFFGFVSPGEVAHREILLTKAGEATLQVLEVGHQSQFVSVKIVPIDIGRKVQVHVQLSPNVPSGPLRDVLEIYTNNATHPVIQVPLHALVRQVDSKSRYGITSLDRLILNLDSELLEFAVESGKGKDVKRLIQNKTEQKTRYEDEKDKLKQACQREVTLSRKPPTFAGAIRVIPAADANEIDTPLHDRLEIERIGMAHATCHEEAQGCTVEDVSAENLGFDIRSKTPDGKIRCIEVKARAGRDPVVLTSNEWFKAKQLKDDYFLYVVLNAATQPELHIIQDPGNRISAVRQITEVRYQVPLSEITQNGEPV